MTKEELTSQLAGIQDSLKQLSEITPRDYEEFNALRLQYDNLNLQMQAVHMQLDALNTIKQIEQMQ